MKRQIKTWQKVLIGVAAVLVLIVIAVVILFWNELRTLATMEKLDDYGMYRMTYYGDYGFDDFLKTGAKSDSDIEKFVTKRLLKGLPIDLGITGDGCTAFVVKNEKDEILYGRNFDFAYAPSLQLYTNPDNGYASISTVNLAFAGYDEASLPDTKPLNQFLTLVGPYLPFDGMNEKGLAIALLAVPEAAPAYDENKVMLNTTTSIRLVLDKAATVEEAVELLSNYNIYFSGDTDCHYLIADASGNSVLVEYYDHDMKVTKTEEDYQIASNFIAYNGVNIGEGFTEFERYDAVEKAITENGNRLDEEKAAALLADIGVRNGDTDKLQWSVIYNLTSGEGQIFAHRKVDQSFPFLLDRKN